jgi:hypothetical protein
LKTLKYGVLSKESTDKIAQMLFLGANAPSPPKHSRLKSIKNNKIY